MNEENTEPQKNTNRFLEIMKMKMATLDANRPSFKEALLIITLIMSLMFLAIKYAVGSPLDDPYAKVAEELVEDIIQIETGIKINSN